MEIEKAPDRPVETIHIIKRSLEDEAHCVVSAVELAQDERLENTADAASKKRELEESSEEESSLSDASSQNENEDCRLAALTKSMAERHRRKNRQWLWRDYTLHMEKMEQFRQRLGLNPPNERPESPTTYFGWNRWGTMVKKGTINEPLETMDALGNSVERDVMADRTTQDGVAETEIEETKDEKNN